MRQFISATRASAILLRRERGVEAPGPHLREVFRRAEKHAQVARLHPDIAQVLQKVGKQAVMGHAFEVDVPLFESALAAFHGRVRPEDFLIIIPDLGVVEVAAVVIWT